MIHRNRHHKNAAYSIVFHQAPALPKRRANHSRIKNRPDLPDEIWQDPGDISSLNLIYGIGGEKDAPDPNATFTFIEEDMKGTSPKFRVKDDQGVEWKAKLGAEPQAETAATRLLWAAGYFVDEDYYEPEIKVKDLPRLHRGGQFVSGDVVHGVRLERKIKGQKDVGEWDWFKNPFREYPRIQWAARDDGGFEQLGFENKQQFRVRSKW